MSIYHDGCDPKLSKAIQVVCADPWFTGTCEAFYAGVCLLWETDQGMLPCDNTDILPADSALIYPVPLIGVKIRTENIKDILANIPLNNKYLQVDRTERIPVITTISELVGLANHRCCALIRDECVLMVWTHDVDYLIPTCKELQAKLDQPIERLNESSHGRRFRTHSPSCSAFSSIEMKQISGNHLRRDTKELVQVTEDHEDDVAALSDVENSAQPRPMLIFAPLYIGLACALSTYYSSNGLDLFIMRLALDDSRREYAPLLIIPLLFCVSLFFSTQIITSIAMVFGPVSHCYRNSRYYSAIRPRANKEVDSRLPHVTIEMPVYKESLKATIAPSVYSIQKAMRTYASQGGTSAIFVHDDALQLLPEAERLDRMRFYSEQNIGYVARPAHEPLEGGFKRNGRFKKASNMNYGLDLSLKLEKYLVQLEAGKLNADLVPGGTYEDKALRLAIEQIYKESDHQHRPWAANPSSLRIGEIILIVDSDTAVPEDCFRDAAREMFKCPEVAIIQHESGVLQVAHHFFENALAYFTRRVNKSASFVCANGEVAPFVGHNAFLRWSALQEVIYVDPLDGCRKIWSDSNVSEDFDMSLRLQLKDYIVRWATYSRGQFKEGVSLTPDDELNRWEKYAYGVAELMLNPASHWLHSGPVNKQLRSFIWSTAPLHSKISMIAYMFSYFGIAAGFTLTLLNYFILGHAMDVDSDHWHAFMIWIFCLIGFPVTSSFAFSILEYRLGHRGFFEALRENMSWIPFFFVFFGGMSIHLSKVLLAYLLGYDIQWSTTRKEVQRSNLFLEIPKIINRYRVALLIASMGTISIFILSSPIVRDEWRRSLVSDWSTSFPFALSCLLHLLYPLLLNPWLMRL